MRVCVIAGCPALVPQGEGARCYAHRRQARAERFGNAVYSTAGHRRFRRAVLHRDPICVLCGVAEATVADHFPDTRIVLVETGRNPNDPEAGRGLCAPCHNRHTAQSSPGGWNARN
ncbi:holin [Mycetocola tolaasinivorans]|uniref:Holin n=1 Tax=Mycetocola tolaasinivorans TaxID=76635 RepID=A0A3L7AAG9_9MICO|nr:holin [Mycetocola tolaasinivorans]